MTATQISVVFFLVGFVAVVPVLYYYYRRNPNPRFRPPLGEMVMISLFALMFVGGGSYFMGTLLSSDPDFSEEALKSPSTRRQTQDPDQQDTGNKSKKKDSGSRFNPFGR